jgi:hypothetical protein
MDAVGHVLERDRELKGVSAAAVSRGAGEARKAAGFSGRVESDLER